MDKSGRVSYRFNEVSGAAGGFGAHTEGRFTTENGYSGKFTTIAFGAGFLAGGGIQFGTGSSRSLSTFSGGNGNLVGLLGPIGISDNFSLDGGISHVGQTDALDVTGGGLGLGASYSFTKLSDVVCPAGR